MLAAVARKSAAVLEALLAPDVATDKHRDNCRRRGFPGGGDFVNIFNNA